MSFLLPLLGAIIGGIAGFSLGDMVHAGYGGANIDMRYLLLAAGTLIGYFIGRLLVRKPANDGDGNDG